MTSLMKNTFLFLLTLSVFSSYAQVSKRNSAKNINIGYYDRYEKLPKLKFDTASEKEFLKQKSGTFITKPKPNQKGNYFFIKTAHQQHKFKIYKDYGEKDGWSGSEFMGHYPVLNLYAIINNSTSENLGFAELMLLDNATDYTYNIISFGDGSVELPIPSPNNKYLVYFYNAVYQHKNSDIGVLKVNGKNVPATFLKEYSSYHSDDFAIEKIIWLNDNSFIVKGYEEVYKNGKWIKIYKFYKTTFK